jgi:uncharacterized repeat protein (TIGR03803 family)
VARTSLRRTGTTLITVLISVLAVTADSAATGKYRVIHVFKGNPDGSQSRAPLVFDQKGNLYGTTVAGGADNAGTVFEMSPRSGGGWDETVLYSFKTDGKDGTAPAATLIFDKSGNLYGTTSAGGANENSGTVFELSPSGNGGWSETVLYSFDRSGGFQPTGALVFDQAGNLYGGTAFGGDQGWGIVYQLTPNGNGNWTETELASFGENGDGTSPDGTFVFDQAGNLYGTVFSGTENGGGLVFELTPNGKGWTENTIYTFESVDEPGAGVIFDQSGNLYGTALSNGGIGDGIVFELSPNGKGAWTEKVLYSFNGTDGKSPYGGLVFDRAGNLYGTTFEGGANGYGVIFKLAPDGKGGWTETVLHSFHGTPGANPWAGLILDASGNLYGTTAGTRKGCAFEITP